MAIWKDLPPEMREEIFNAILSSMDSQTSKAICAAVCREWQTYFEHRNFRKLVLSHSCIKDFRQMVQSREAMVKHIWLRVQPPQYDCSICGNSEPSERLRRNNQVFTNALWQLMEILSSWGKLARNDQNPDGLGLILELSVHPPGNLKHHLDCCTFDKDIHPCSAPEKCTNQASCSLSSQLRPKELRSYICDVVRRRMNLVEELRTFESVELDFGDIEDEQSKKLPVVGCVKELFIRPQHLRRLHPQTVSGIIKSFGRVESVHFEPEML